MIKSIVGLVKPAFVKSNGMIRELLNLGTLELDIFHSKPSIEPPKPRCISISKSELNEGEAEDNESTNPIYVSYEDLIKSQLEKPFVMNIHSMAVILNDDTTEDLQRVKSECITSTQIQRFYKA
ncbi:unnamed protein product [Arctia plantaginis]|uniref:Uncharacterized protein n=1 Tax=Arctia plantaginis TaxID=874455 RepID=A0A8S1BQ22_ARCPL|nr:unnamed protein product [Arctia plantaginis]